MSTSSADLAQLEHDLTRIDARLNAIAGGNGEPSDEDLAEYARLSEEREAAERAVHEARARVRQSLNLGSERPHDQRPPVPGSVIAAGQERSYEKLFGRPQASTWKAGEWLNCVLHGWHDPRLQMSAAMGEGEGSHGGLLVPQVLEKQLLDRALHQSIVMQRATIRPMTSKQLTIASYAGTDQTQGLTYGMTFQFVAEHEEVQPGSGLIRGLTLNSHVGVVYTAASDELVADSPNFESELMLRMGDVVGDALDSYLLAGNGAGVPLGFLRSGALYVVPKESGQANGSIETSNILRMMSHATSYQSAVWIANPSCLVQLGQLLISEGASTASATLLTRSAEGLSILGRPLLLHHKMPVLGQQNDIVLANLADYTIGLRQGTSIDSSIHPGYLRRELTLRAVVRVDGQPTVLTPYTGADLRQYSGFVTLAART